MPPNLCANVNLSNNGVINKELPNNINKDNKDYSNINNQNIIIVYNKVIGGNKEEIFYLIFQGRTKIYGIIT